MLEGLRHFIADVVSPIAHQDRKFDDTGYRLAATALLIHVISIDGEPTEAEKRKLHSLIESSFGLDDWWSTPDCTSSTGQGNRRSITSDLLSKPPMRPAKWIGTSSLRGRLAPT